MRVVLPRRTVSAGDELDLLVLAVAAGELIAVDLASGAFVRAVDPGGDQPLRPFDVLRAELGDDAAAWSPHAPEAVELAGLPELTGHLGGRRADRFLRPLLDPPGDHLLGFPGPAVPFWTLTGDRPSLALVAPSAGPVVMLDPASGFRCRFAWRGRHYDLPLFDTNVVTVLDQAGRHTACGHDLDRLLGYRAARLVIALSPPWRGHCYKVAAALLPRH